MNDNRTIRLARCATTALLVALASSAFAQEERAPENGAALTTGTNSAPGQNGELARFGKFLELHPNIEARLRENPGLATNAAFQKNHPQFAGFLEQHPGILAEISAKPRWFIHRELARQSASPITHQQIAEFDRFLDQHPAIEAQLAEHPNQLHRADFLHAHAELHEYLKKHPGLDRAAESKPERLMERERLRERAETIKGKP